MSTSIEWTDETWNPVTGCTKVSAGCKHCYAETFAGRGIGSFTGGRKFTDVRTHEDRLDEPLRRRTPRKWFVNSMSDLFHVDVPDEFIDRVFGVMHVAQRYGGHTFQVLTKRPDRMLRYVTTPGRAERVDQALLSMQMPRHVGGWVCLAQGPSRPDHWPLPNLWLGVSCEDQKAWNERVPFLVQTPAAVRFVSGEPLLGGINCSHVIEENGWCARDDAWDRKAWDCIECGGTGWLEPAGPQTRACSCRLRGHAGVGIDWVIVGGESGTGARPFHAAWARSILEQCRSAGVACFVKQLGRFPAVDPVPDGDIAHASCLSIDGKACAVSRCGSNTGFLAAGAGGWKDVDALQAGVLMHRRLRDPKGGDPAEWPEDLRVREFPEVAR